MNKLQKLQELGQSIWYDNIQRDMLGEQGELARMIREDRLAGVTSNPSIFEKAIGAGSDYDKQLNELLNGYPDMTRRELFFSLAIDDIQHAADLLQPVYEATQGKDGYVSLEVSPDLAYDTESTIREAKELVQRVNRANLMIKVPSTLEGVPAVEALTAAGVNVNATLLFSVERYEQVAKAYIRGLQQRASQGESLAQVGSVASFFVSRVDTLVDKLLEEKLSQADDNGRALIEALMGQVAVLNAKAAYKVYQGLYDDSFAALREQGARPQRLLWASSGTKNPAYSDILYLDSLIGPNTVNTVPPATYKAYLDHGEPAPRLLEGLDEAAAELHKLAQLGIDLTAATQRLEDEGVAAFQQAFDKLLSAIESKSKLLIAV